MKHSYSKVLGLVLLASGSLVRAQDALLFYPTQPVASTPVFLSSATFRTRCYGTDYRPEQTRVEVVDSRIKVSMPEPLLIRFPGAQCPAAYPLVSLGEFPPGEYAIEIYYLSNEMPAYRGTLTVATDPAVQPGLPAHDYSGLFHDPALDGSGLLVAQNPQGRIAAMWATYDEQGRQAWYMVALGEWSKGAPETPEGQVYRAPLFRSRDGAPPTFPSDAIAPGAVVEAVGEIELRFSVSSVDEAVATYRLGTQTGTRTLRRFDY